MNAKHVYANPLSQFLFKLKRYFKFNMYKSGLPFCHPKVTLYTVFPSQFIATPSFQVLSQKSWSNCFSLPCFISHIQWFSKLWCFKNVSSIQFPLATSFFQISSNQSNQFLVITSNLGILFFFFFPCLSWVYSQNCV